MHISPSSLLIFLSILHLLFILNWLIHLSRLYVIILLISLLCRVQHTKYESQSGINIVRRNINNLRYADDITLMAESEDELKTLLMKVKKESEKAGLKLNIQKN